MNSQGAKIQQTAGRDRKSERRLSWVGKGHISGLGSRILPFLVGCLFASMLACSSNDLYDDMPREIQSFVAQYFPNTQLDSFTSTKDSYTVILRNGPTIVFDSSCHWTKVDGNGSTLPQVLMFNDLPPALYSYLQETEDTDNVFEVERTAKTYTVELLTRTLTYNISTGEITGEES